MPTTISANVLNQDSTLSTVFVAQPITKLIAVNALVRISEADEKIAQAKLDQGTKQLLSGVTQVYYGLSGALHIQAALQLQASLLEQQLALTNVPDLRIGLVELRQGLLQVQGTVRDLSDQLNDLVGLPPVTALVIEDPVPPLPPVATADQASQMAAGLQFRNPRGGANHLQSGGGIESGPHGLLARRERGRRLCQSNLR